MPSFDLASIIIIPSFLTLGTVDTSDNNPVGETEELATTKEDMVEIGSAEDEPTEKFEETKTNETEVSRTDVEKEENQDVKQEPDISTENTSDELATTEEEDCCDESILEKIENMDTNIKGLSEQFEAKIKMDEGKNKLINDMYDELQSYKDGMHYKLYKPIINDIIDVFQKFINKF